jgi:predicted NBD/HSP70 family sugar kinase
VLENDARCFAQAEHLMGAGKGARNSVSITLGTGVGSGIIIDGRIYRGSHGGAGEIGHLRIPAEGMAEFEHLLSGPGIIARHRARGGSEDHPARIWESRTPEAKATREETEAFLATFAENIIMMLDPDVIILGGGVSNLPLTPSANRLLRAHNHKPILRQGKLGDDAGIIGAALIAKG